MNEWYIEDEVRPTSIEILMTTILAIIVVVISVWVIWTYGAPIPQTKQPVKVEIKDGV